MFVGVLTFESENPHSEAEVEEVKAKVNELADTIIVPSPGFYAYYFYMPSPTELVNVSLFDSQAEYVAMSGRAMPRVMEIWGSTLVGPPQRLTGEALVQRVK